MYCSTECNAKVLVPFLHLRNDTSPTTKWLFDHRAARACITPHVQAPATLKKHALSVIMRMEKTLIMGVWIWMCFAKGTSARLYKHCANLQEATKVMTPPNHVGPLCTIHQHSSSQKTRWQKPSRHLTLILKRGNQYRPVQKWTMGKEFSGLTVKMRELYTPLRDSSVEGWSDERL